MAWRERPRPCGGDAHRGLCRGGRVKHASNAPEELRQNVAKALPRGVAVNLACPDFDGGRKLGSRLPRSGSLVEENRDVGDQRSPPKDRGLTIKRIEFQPSAL